jgi:hypothetical protein
MAVAVSDARNYFKRRDELMKYRRLWVTAIVLFMAALIVLPTTAQEKFRENYRAFVVNMTTTNPPIVPTGRSTTMDITVTRWTTDEEREFLLTELIEKGQEDFIKALQKQEETGFVRVTGRAAELSTFPSERLRYAREFKDGDKRRLVLALDRPISFFEAMRRPRWSDYNFSLIVIDLDEEGKGEGSLALAVKLAVDRENKRLVVENYGSEPLRLTRVSKTN